VDIKRRFPADEVVGSLSSATTKESRMASIWAGLRQLEVCGFGPGIEQRALNAVFDTALRLARELYEFEAGARGSAVANDGAGFERSVGQIEPNGNTLADWRGAAEHGRKAADADVKGDPTDDR
jgi:hypothetical protein